MKVRAVFLRFGASVQRLSVLQAYQEFYALWLEEMQENRIPNVGTLCALVASHQGLPTKGDVGEAWIKAAQKVLEDPEREWELVGHDFTETVQRLSCSDLHYDYRCVLSRCGSTAKHPGHRDLSNPGNCREHCAYYIFRGNGDFLIQALRFTESTGNWACRLQDHQLNIKDHQICKILRTSEGKL